MSEDWAAVRREFPALEHWTYLNTATYGQVPKRAVEAMTRHSIHRDQTACTDFLDWYAEVNGIRGSIARLIRAEPEDIAFVGNAATALHMVLSGIALKPGENVVTLEQEFPNYLYIDSVRQPAWRDFYEAIDERTRLVAISQVNYSTGFRPPLSEISQRLAKRGIPLFVDGCQSVGALSFDVTETPVDVLAVHAYKWMISPTGAGFMYVAPRFRGKLAPSVMGWRSHFDWRNVDQLHHGSPQFVDGAEKYEGGGLPFHLLYAMGAVTKWMLEIGPHEIERRVLELARATRAILRELGAEAAETESQVVTGRFPERDASQMARALKEKKVVISARHGNLRIAPHFYNNEDDLEKLRTSLKALL